MYSRNLRNYGAGALSAMYGRKIWPTVAILLLTLLALPGSAQQYVTNPNAGTSTNTFPFGSTSSRKVQEIYLPGELINAKPGNITKLYVRRGNASATSVSGLKITMLQTTQTNFSGNPDNYVTGATTVLSNGTFASSSGKVDDYIPITLQTPFYYDPNKTLVITISHTTTSGTVAMSWRTSTPPSGSGYRRVFSADESDASGKTDNNWYNIGVDIAPATANDAGLLGFNAICVGNNDIKATLVNYGTNDLTSATLNWSLDGVTQTAVNWTGKLSIGKSDEVVLASKAFTASTIYDIKAWTTNPNGKTDSVPDNDTIQDKNYRSSFSGTYTIDPKGSGVTNFKDFGDAITAITNTGLCGPVIFEVAPGTYNEAVTVTAIPGASATNTVTFDGKDSSKVEITHSGTSASTYTFELSSANYITIKNMTITNTAASSYGVGVHITNGSDYNHVQSCIINVSATATATTVYGLGISGTSYSTSGNHGNYNHIDNCHISGGYLGVVIYGSSTSIFTQSNKVTNCTIDDFYTYGIRCYYHEKTEFTGNKIVTRAGTNSSYGIYSYYGNGGFRYENNEINVRYAGFYISSNGTILNDENFILNNMVYGTTASTGYGIYCTTMKNMTFYHNSVHHTSNAGYGMYMTGTSSNNDVRDNIFSKVSNNAYCLYVVNASYVTILDNNDYYSLGGNFVYIGTAYGNLADLKAGNKSFNQASLDVDPDFVNTSPGSIDLHIDANASGPSGAYVGIDTDKDGKTRCKTFPTMGADESTFGKNNNLVKFFLPGNIYPGSPAIIYQSAKPGEPKIHNWYLNGVKISDSVTLVTTQFKNTGDMLKLVTIGCGGTDSFEQSITLTLPTAAPGVQFVADKNAILEGQKVRFIDLSTNGPNTWQWEISPDSTYDQGFRVPRYKYTYGDANSPIMDVQFNYPGRYKVCLTTSNLLGQGKKLCKTEYIYVHRLLKLSKNSAFSADSSGYLFDDGGPDGSYSMSSQKQTAVIAPCASEAYLVFNYFDLSCGEDYLRVYDGVDPNGTPLHSCTNNYNSSAAAGPGLSGGKGGGASCGFECIPLKTDTFISKSGKFFIEMETANGPSYKGFEAYWWSKSSNMARPVAKFDAPDSICVSKQIFLSNKTTSQSKDVSYIWDLDGDLSTVEYDGDATTTWAYFYPGFHRVTMIATNCGGSDTFTKDIKVYTTGTPKPEFSVDNNNPSVGDVVFFRNDTKECMEEMRWTITKKYGSSVKDLITYVNNTDGISNNPKVVFGDTGCYSVQLYARNDAGKDSLTRSCYINVKAGYCPPSVANRSTDLGISNVTFNTINNSTASGSADHTSYVSTINTHLDQGTQVELTVQRPTANNNISIAAWIDWNSDGDFDDNGEEVAYEASFAGKSYSATIAIPGTARVGATVMRIGTNYENLPNLACGQNQFGEYEDYRLYIHTDATKPVIKLLGTDTVYVEQGYPYTDAGATAEDNVDGDITADIKSFNNLKLLIPGTYTYTYDVMDAAQNKAVQKKRIVIVTEDKTPPTLRIEKPDTLYIPVGDPLSFQKVISAEDLVDGDMASLVNISHGINMNVVDTYTVNYSVEDGSSNLSVVQRTVIVFDDILPVMTLIGDSAVVHEVNTPYTDLDVIISDNYYTATELRKRLVVASNVNEARPGVYKVTYMLTDPSGNGPVTRSRKVTVQDTTAPVVALIGAGNIKTEVNEVFIDPGANVSDNYSQFSGWDTAGTYYATFGNGKPDIVGIYTIIYSATDSAGNTASITRTVEVVDTKAPVITLKGEPGVNVCRWAAYQDEGYELSDNYYKAADITVSQEGSFTTGGTDMEGIYNMRYKAVDKSGNVAYSGWRAVNVQACQSGMNENTLEGKAVQIYPNPNNGSFNLKLELPAGAQGRISVTNILGEEIAVISNGMLASGTYAVNMGQQPSGIYLVKITTGKITVTKRVSIVL